MERDVLARQVFDLCVELVAGADVTAHVTAAGIALAPPHPDAGACVILGTSGSSTGRPNRVVLPVASLRASAMASAQRLGHGQWISCLPAQFVGGFQVLFRSALAGCEPIIVSAGMPLAAALAQVPPAPGRFLSIVPAQLRQLLDARPDDPVQGVLRGCSAILVGGDALTPALRDESRRAGLNVVSTYGMTETCGGCVYDGVPLPGVRVRIEDERVWLGGPMLASSYLDAASPFTTLAGERWLVTGDVGHFDGERLTITGRADDVIISAGHNVVPQEVERLVQEVAGEVLANCDWAITATPDETWGAVVTLAIASRGTADLESVGQRALEVCADLPSTLRPRRVRTLPALPRTASGKLNRRELAQASGDPSAHLEQ